MSELPPDPDLDDLARGFADARRVREQDDPGDPAHEQATLPV
jgi:hypothetical protein